MNLRMKISAACYLINIVYMLGAGFAFVFAGEFFPFHSDVIQTAWEDVDKLSQTLYLGMMRTEGAGFLASAVAMAVIFYIPFRQGQQWSYWALTAIGLIEHLPTFVATHHVSTITNASPPWPITLALMALLVLGLVLALTGKGKV